MFTSDALHTIARDRVSDLFASRPRRARHVPAARPAAVVVTDDHGRDVTLAPDGVSCDGDTGELRLSACR